MNTLKYNIKPLDDSSRACISNEKPHVKPISVDDKEDQPKEYFTQIKNTTVSAFVGSAEALGLFLYLASSATYSPVMSDKISPRRLPCRHRRKVFELKMGEVLTTFTTLKKAAGLSKESIYRYLKILKDMDAISYEKFPRHFSIIVKGNPTRNYADVCKMYTLPSRKKKPREGPKPPKGADKKVSPSDSYQPGGADSPDSYQPGGADSPDSYQPGGADSRNSLISTIDKRIIDNVKNRESSLSHGLEGEKSTLKAEEKSASKKPEQDRISGLRKKQAQAHAESNAVWDALENRDESMGPDKTLELEQTSEELAAEIQSYSKEISDLEKAAELNKTPIDETDTPNRTSYSAQEGKNHSPADVSNISDKWVIYSREAALKCDFNRFPKARYSYAVRDILDKTEFTAERVSRLIDYLYSGYDTVLASKFIFPWQYSERYGGTTKINYAFQNIGTWERKQSRRWK